MDWRTIYKASEECQSEYAEPFRHLRLRSADSDFPARQNTGDDKDWTFSDADEHCYYFFFPVGGGTRTETDFYYHSTTPIISSQKICISKSVITLETTCVVYKVTHAGRRKIKHKALEPLMTKTLTLL